MSKELRQQSRTIFNGEGTLEAINTGCFQRMADAQEAMAKPFLELIRDVEFLRKSNQRKKESIESLTNINRTLRGHITRLKNKEKGGSNE